VVFTAYHDTVYPEKITKFKSAGTSNFIDVPAMRGVFTGLTSNGTIVY